MTQFRHDTVIVGGGLVGGLTALLLQLEGKQPVVLDAAPTLNESTVLSQVDTRVLALNIATIHLLKKVGVWQYVKRHAPYTGMHVWNKNGHGEIYFGQSSDDYTGLSTDWLGSMVEPSVINLAIQQRMLEVLENYRTHISVQKIEPDEQGWCIQLSDGENIYTRLVVGADGGNSLVRQHAGIDIKSLDYKQAAIGCAIKTKLPHHSVARQIFLPTGPLAYLPLAVHESSEQGFWQSIVWTLPQQLCQEYMQLSDEEFKTQLTQSSLYLQGGVVDVSQRASFLLKARAAKSYVKPGVALVGDAAHVIHPLAGQGVNIGCLDAAILVDALMNSYEKTGQWASIKSLKNYERRRKIENEMTMHSMSFMNWLQQSNMNAVVWARTFGLRQVHRFEPLKYLFMQQASGVSALAKSRYQL